MLRGQLRSLSASLAPRLVTIRFRLSDRSGPEWSTVALGRETPKLVTNDPKWGLRPSVAVGPKGAQAARSTTLRDGDL